MNTNNFPKWMRGKKYLERTKTEKPTTGLKDTLKAHTASKQHTRVVPPQQQVGLHEGSADHSRLLLW